MAEISDFECMNCGNPAFIGDTKHYVLCKGCFNHIWNTGSNKSLNKRRFLDSINESILEEQKLKAIKHGKDLINPKKLRRKD